MRFKEQLGTRLVWQLLLNQAPSKQIRMSEPLPCRRFQSLARTSTIWLEPFPSNPFGTWQQQTFCPRTIHCSCSQRVCQHLFRSSCPRCPCQWWGCNHFSAFRPLPRPQAWHSAATPCPWTRQTLDPQRPRTAGRSSHYWRSPRARARLNLPPQRRRLWRSAPRARHFSSSSRRWKARASLSEFSRARKAGSVRGAECGKRRG
mmetsp:Transcript_5996/g.12142  ORF Transcript_5996/g.12142 Transcript_5996/m.12142 type:complete len:203 (-) Transcript_5996:398-1006(-)